MLRLYNGTSLQLWDHNHLDAGLDVAVDLDGHLVGTEGFYGLGEPKSRSSSPVRASMVMTLLFSVSATSVARSARRLSRSSASSICRRASSSLAGVATSASPR